MPKTKAVINSETSAVIQQAEAAANDQQLTPTEANPPADDIATTQARIQELKEKRSQQSFKVAKISDLLKDEKAKLTEIDEELFPLIKSSKDRYQEEFKEILPF